MIPLWEGASLSGLKAHCHQVFQVHRINSELGGDKRVETQQLEPGVFLGEEQASIAAQEHFASPYKGPGSPID